MGWFQDRKRHSLAAKGVETGHRAEPSGSMNAKPLNPLEQAARSLFRKREEEPAHDPEPSEKEIRQEILKIDPTAKVSRRDIEIMQREFREAQQAKARGEI